MRSSCEGFQKLTWDDSEIKLPSMDAQQYIPLELQATYLYTRLISAMSASRDSRFVPSGRGCTASCGSFLTSLEDPAGSISAISADRCTIAM